MERKEKGLLVKMDASRFPFLHKTVFKYSKWSKVRFWHLPPDHLYVLQDLTCSLPCLAAKSRIYDSMMPDLTQWPSRKAKIDNISKSQREQDWEKQKRRTHSGREKRETQRRMETGQTKCGSASKNVCLSVFFPAECVYSDKCEWRSAACVCVCMQNKQGWWVWSDALRGEFCWWRTWMFGHPWALIQIFHWTKALV